MRPILDQKKVDDAALNKMSAFGTDVLAEVKKAVDSHEVVVIGMGLNPYCKKARQLLAERNIAYEYLEYGNYLTGWKPRLAIKLWTGWPTYPQVFIGGKLIGGFEDLKAHLVK